MLTKKLLKKEVYAVVVEGRTLFYAPLTRTFAVCDDSLTLENADEEWIQSATSMANVPDFVRNQGFTYDKEKIRLRLNITTGCNLKCSYCSVRAGGGFKNMPDNIALGAVRGFCKFAHDHGAKTLEVVFSGGEPTLCISLIEKCIKEAKQHLAGGIMLQPRLLTNGLFKRDDYLKIMGEIAEIQVSWDGFFGENQRYGSDGSLAQRVWDNIQFLVDSGVDLSVLTVVSETNHIRIREVVDQLYECGVRHIFLGLKENLGRASQDDLRINLDELGDIYFDLWKHYRALGVDINLTGTDIHSISPFPCSVPIPNYSVSPDGEVSACSVTFNDRSQWRDVFRIGDINGDNVTVDTHKLENVRNFHVLNISGCDTCFAKWHCRGGCIYAKGGEWFKPLSPERCKMVRSVVSRKLLFVIDEQSSDL